MNVRDPDNRPGDLHTDASGNLYTTGAAADQALIGALTETAPATDTASSGLNGRLQRIAQRLTSLIALLPASLGIKTAANSLSVAPASDAVYSVVGFTANPTSGVLTRPADTNAYAANDLVASSTTAGSVVVPSVSIMRIAAGGGSIPKMLLFTNHTTGLSGITAAVRLWSAAPTYTNGDNGAYAVATGAAGFLAKFQGIWEQYGDGAVAVLTPSDGSPLSMIKLASGQSVYWDLETGAFTPQSGKTFTLVPQISQD